MAQIKPIELIRRLAPAGGGVGLHSLVTSATARQSLSFLELWWPVFDEFAPTGSQRREERVYANLNRRRAATKPGNGEAAQPMLVDGEGSLQWSFDSKDMHQGFLELPSNFLTDQLLRSAVENSNLVTT
jgi:hypothetical protein